MDQIITNQKKIVFHISYNPVELNEMDPLLSALTIANSDTVVSFQGPGISWSFPLRAIKSMQVEVFPESSPLPSEGKNESKIPDQKRMPNENFAPNAVNFFPDPNSFEIRVPKAVAQAILKTQPDPFGFDAPEEKQMKLSDEFTPSIPIYNLDV